MSLPVADLAVHGEEPAQVDEAERKAIVGRSPLKIAMDRLRADKAAVVCTVIIVLLVGMAILAPLITKLMNIHERTEEGGLDPNLVTDGLNFPLPEYGPPYGGFTFAHPLGLAPNTAFDNFARLIYGLRTSLEIALIATVASVIIGLAVGLAAGYSRGWVDRVLSFTIDLFFGFPLILFAVSLAAVITSQFAQNDNALETAQVVSLIVVMSSLGWMGLARLVRGQVLSLREREFVLAAQVIGQPSWRILVREMVPNLMASLVVAISFMIPGFIATEVALSALGIGLKGTPSLGSIINSANGYYQSYPLYLWAPVAVTTILVIALNLLGDSVRDAFDPKTRR